MEQHPTEAFYQLVRLFNQMDSGVHGILHIWLDDGNYEGHHVTWLAAEARGGDSWQHEQYPDQTRLGAYIARIAVDFTDDERRAIYEDWGRDGWLDGPHHGPSTPAAAKRHLQEYHRGLIDHVCTEVLP